MKILVVTPYFYPKIGGLENYAYQFCIGLKKKYKAEIIVITSNHKGKKDIIEVINGLKIYRLAPLFKLSNTPINPLWYLKIKKIIYLEKPDIINAHTPVPFIADMTALVAGTISFLLTYHAYSLYKYRSFLLNGVIRVYSLLEYFLFKKATKILLVSETITKNIPRKFKDKIIIVNNSLTRQAIPKIKRDKQAGEIHVVFIGSLDFSHEWKGLFEILRAIQLFCQATKKNIKVSVIGEGNNKISYVKRAKEYGIEKQVTFLGRKEGKEKHKILRKATIGVVYPKSSNDAFPTVVLEYWAYKLPIIAENILPINNLLTHKKTAYLVAPNNALSLSKAFAILSSQKKLSKTIARYGYEELHKKYLFENELEKFYELVKLYSI